MALALNNLKTVDMPLNKETNQPTLKGIGSQVNLCLSYLFFLYAYFWRLK